MILRNSDTIGCVIEKSSHIFKGCVAMGTICNTSFLLGRLLDFSHTILQMHTKEMNHNIALTKILILTGFARACNLLSIIGMTRSHMEIQQTLLEKAHITVLALVRQEVVVLLHMVVHRRLVVKRASKFTMGALETGIRADIFELLLPLCSCSRSFDCICHRIIRLGSCRGIHRRSLTDLNADRHGYFKYV